MPRETVISSEPETDRFLLDVGWSRDCDMQVGIRSWDDRHLVDEFYGDTGVTAKVGLLLVEKLGAAGLTLTDENSDGDHPEVTSETLGRIALDAVTGSDYGISSLWWNPDRAQVNHLIRLLRKARDMAFGRDE